MGKPLIYSNEIGFFRIKYLLTIKIYQ